MFVIFEVGKNATALTCGWIAYTLNYMEIKWKDFHLILIKFKVLAIQPGVSAVLPTLIKPR